MLYNIVVLVYVHIQMNISYKQTTVIFQVFLLFILISVFDLTSRWRYTPALRCLNSSVLWR